jgi:hypothetical protein
MWLSASLTRLGWCTYVATQLATEYVCTHSTSRSEAAQAVPRIHNRNTFSCRRHGTRQTWRAALEAAKFVDVAPLAVVNGKRAQAEPEDGATVLELLSGGSQSPRISSLVSKTGGTAWMTSMRGQVTPTMSPAAHRIISPRSCRAGAIDSRVVLPLDNADARLLTSSSKAAFNAVSEVVFPSETQFIDKFGGGANSNASDKEDGRFGKNPDVLQLLTHHW